MGIESFFVDLLYKNRCIYIYHNIDLFNHVLHNMNPFHHRSRQYAESSEDENTDYRRDVVSKSWMRFFDDGKFPYIPRGSRYSAETYSSSKTERFY